MLWGLCSDIKLFGLSWRVNIFGGQGAGKHSSITFLCQIIDFDSDLHSWAALHDGDYNFV